jgi:ketosteroid isomerase-like protein
MTKTILALLLTLTAGSLAALASASSQDTDDELDIEAVIHDSIGWALTKDFDLLYSCFVDDESFFIFHPDSRTTIKGIEAFRRHAERVFASESFVATDFEVKQLSIHRSKGGDVAWYSCLLDDHGTWDDEPIGWDDARWTGVLVKQEGRWRIAQMHFSLAADRVLAEAAAAERGEDDGRSGEDG